MIIVWLHLSYSNLFIISYKVFVFNFLKLKSFLSFYFWNSCKTMSNKMDSLCENYVAPASLCLKTIYLKKNQRYESIT